MCNDLIKQLAPVVDRMQFRVPFFVHGRPPVNVNHATRYVRDKLERNGFKTTLLSDGMIDVDWSHARESARPAIRKEKKTKEKEKDTGPKTPIEDEPPKKNKKEEPSTVELLRSLQKFAKSQKRR
jgi:hypothetical protein